MKWLKIFYQRLCQSLRLMVGVPDYEAFVEHWKTHHQGSYDDECPSYEAFFRERQAKRYSSSAGKCC